MGEAERMQFTVEGGGEVSALLMLPAEARVMLALAHGAGAGMAHPFLASLAAELAAVAPSSN